MRLDLFILNGSHFYDQSICGSVCRGEFHCNFLVFFALWILTTIYPAANYSHNVCPVVEGEALLHMEELGNYTLKYLARRRTRKPPHDLVTGQTPDYMLSN